MKTILGDVPEQELGVFLCHEHICCYSEYLYTMAGSGYLDKERLLQTAVSYLKEMKETHGLGTLIDCTPVNIGRDPELLKAVSAQSGVHIVCATGFYYTEEPLLASFDAYRLVDAIVTDARNINAGIIKCAVEQEQLRPIHEKLLKACAGAQLQLGIPILLHTNANNRNGQKAVEILLEAGVSPQSITVGHLSDTGDLDYIRSFAEKGCFIGFDRLYAQASENYVNGTVAKIMDLWDRGYGAQILLSHDALFFNGFEADPAIREKPRFSYCFDHILPRLPQEVARKIMQENPVAMLKCELPIQ